MLVRYADVVLFSDYGFMEKSDTKECIKDDQFKDDITYCLDNYVYELISSGLAILCCFYLYFYVLVHSEEIFKIFYEFSCF